MVARSATFHSPHSPTRAETERYAFRHAHLTQTASAYCAILMLKVSSNAVGTAASTSVSSRIRLTYGRAHPASRTATHAALPNRRNSCAAPPRSSQPFY